MINLFDCCLMIDANKRLFDVEIPMKPIYYEINLFDCCFTKQVIAMNVGVNL